MTPLEDLFWTRTNRDRVGTIRDGSNHVLLLRDFDRLIGQGLIKRTSDVREISADSRKKIFYEEQRFWRSVRVCCPLGAGWSRVSAVL
jgi:hypothetical protein